MDRLRRRRRDEGAEDWRAPAPQHDPPQGSDAASLLDLQARAGNRAVTELVGAPAPDAGRPSVQRDGADGTPTATPDDGGKPPRAYTLSIPDLKLAVPIQSIEGLRNAPSGRGGRGGREGDKPSTAGELTVTFAAEHLTSKVWEAMVKARQFETVTIRMGSATITLHSVILSGAQAGKETASLTLNFSSMEFDPGSRPPQPTSEHSE